MKKVTFVRLPVGSLQWERSSLMTETLEGGLSMVGARFVVLPHV